jgi:hypothetical protein
MEAGGETRGAVTDTTSDALMTDQTSRMQSQTPSMASDAAAQCTLLSPGKPPTENATHFAVTPHTGEHKPHSESIRGRDATLSVRIYFGGAMQRASTRPSNTQQPSSNQAVQFTLMSTGKPPTENATHSAVTPHTGGAISIDVVV